LIPATGAALGSAASTLQPLLSIASATTLVELVGRCARVLSPFDAMGAHLLVLWRADGSTLDLVYARGLSATSEYAAEAAAPSGPAGEVARSGQAAWVEHPAAEGADQRAALWLPVKAEGKTFGAFGVFAADAAVLSAHQDALTTIAGLIALACERIAAGMPARFARPVVATDSPAEAGPSVSYLLGTVPDAVVGMGLDGRILYWNRAAETLTGYSQQQAVGQPVTMIMPERFRAAHLRGMARHIETGEARVIGRPVELVVVHVEGHEVPVELSLSRVDEGQGVYFMGVLRDIRSRKHAEELRAEEAQRTRRFTEALLQIGRHAAQDFEPFKKDLSRTTAEALGVDAVTFCRMTDAGMVCRDRYEPNPNLHSSVTLQPPQEMVAYLSALRHEDSVVAPDVKTHPATSVIYEQLLAPNGVVSMLDAPMRAFGETIGVVCVESKTTRDWRPSEVSFVKEVAAAMLQAVERSERQRLEARHSVILASIGDAVIACDTEGRVTLMNPIAEQLTGWSTADAIGRPISDVFRIISSETREPAQIPVESVLATGLIHGLANHTVLIRRDGSETAIADSAAPIVEEGAIIGVVLTFRDVTEEEATRREIERQNLRFRSLGQALPDKLFSLTLDGKVRHWLDNSEAPPLRSTEALPASTQEALRRAAGASVQEGKVQTVEYAGTGAHAHEYYEARVAAMGAGEATVLVRNITEKREQVHALEQERSRLSTVLSSTSAVIYAARLPTFEIEYASDSALAVLGFTAAEFSAPGFWEQGLHPDDRDRVFANLPQLFVNGRHQHEYRLRHRDGHYLWLRDDVRLVHDASGAPVSAIGASFDISSRKNDEARLNRLLELKRLVLAVSHTFLDADGGDGAQRVERALAAIGGTISAQRVYLYAVDRAAASNTHEWCAPGVAPRRLERKHVPRAWLDEHFGGITTSDALQISARSTGPASAMLSAGSDVQTIAVPMVLNGEFQGMLCLDAPVTAPLEFEEFASVLQLIAGAITTGLRRISDDDALHRLNERMSVRSERQRALLALANDLARATSRGALLAELRRSLRAVLRHEHVSFLELDPSNGRYRLWAIEETSSPDAEIRNGLAPLTAPGSGLSATELVGTAMGYALSTSKPVSTREHERSAFSDWVTAHRRTGDKHYIVIPMIGAIGTFGTLNVSGAEDAVPTVEQIEWAAQCAAIASAHLSKQAAQEQLLLANAQLAERVESRTRELGASDDRFQRLFQYAPQAMLITNEAGVVVQSNRTAQALFGYDESSLSGVACRALLPDSDWSVARADAGDVGTMRGVRKDGLPFIADTGLVKLNLNGEPHVLVGLSDVSERVTAQATVTRSLREKETLLMEIHHRVKNNLQIISSLLMLQSQQMPSETAKAMLEESVFRVRSMALIHQQLYGAESLERVDLGSYARSLAESVRSTFAPTARVHVSATLAEVTVDFAVPLGLILNELLTNAFKYGVRQAQALPVDAAEPTPAAAPEWDVLVEIRSADDAVRVAVTDRGPGLPPGFDPANSNTLGLQLVRSLTRQLRGRFSVVGPRFEVVSPLARAT